ncbi:hypothetical protein ASE70_15070 [Sphingomonas sp. Leaf22]|uniref:hypothetical protein n=1 Tax=Sphingomonas sp. Leaf22 TaxID=1735687 RepID=UPI0006F5598D|nr:hypothetical protein [Sphingomonas sp. Leaf22]KQM92233.1 hypothetical protein ASE70_15070 [Sphingomonas sp. Leaf22]
MSIVDVPYYRVKNLTLRPVLFSGEQGGDLGNPVLPLPRLGDRFALDVTTDRLRNDPAGRQLMAALFEASNGSARFPVRLPNQARAYPSSIAVDGAGQAGMTIAIKGSVPGLFFRRGDLFNLIHGGRRYLHMVAGPGSPATSADGKVIVPIWPMLRVLTNDGDRIDFVAPQIEGQLKGIDRGAAFARNRTDPYSFSITERE